MEKTLSLGAFEELSENEVMVTEGGNLYVVAATGLVIIAAAVPVIVDINCAVKGVKNYATVAKNKITGSLMPAGMPNPNYDWTIY